MKVIHCCVACLLLYDSVHIIMYFSLKIQFNKYRVKEKEQKWVVTAVEVIYWCVGVTRELMRDLTWRKEDGWF